MDEEEYERCIGESCRRLKKAIPRMRELLEADPELMEGVDWGRRYRRQR